MKDVNELISFETKFYDFGAKFIAGIDEVGRGPLAGPVVVCAIIMDPTKEPIKGVDDSKKVTEKNREMLFDQIIANCISYNLASAEPEEIDKINILNATKKCMKEALEGLSVKPDITLIDAVKIDTNYKVVSIIHGDALSYSIACASIVAKVTRDRLMCNYDASFPEYGFMKHKGYGTKFHIDAIKCHGICELHRKSFVKNFFEDTKC